MLYNVIVMRLLHVFPKSKNIHYRIKVDIKIGLRQQQKMSPGICKGWIIGYIGIRKIVGLMMMMYVIMYCYWCDLYSHHRYFLARVTGGIPIWLIHYYIPIKIRITLLGTTHAQIWLSSSINLKEKQLELIFAIFWKNF